MPGSFAQVCMLGHQSGAAEIAKPVGSHAPSFAEISAAADFACDGDGRELVGEVDFLRQIAGAKRRPLMLPD